MVALVALLALTAAPSVTAQEQPAGKLTLTVGILTGEPPDPTRVPGGCRFHPRCPALASGDAAWAGVDDRCRDQAVPILRGATEHHAACFLTDESVKKEAERRPSTRGGHAEGPH